MSHAELNREVVALTDRKHAPDAANSAHRDVQSAVVHAALFVENRFNERRVDVGNELGGTLDVVGQIRLALHNDQCPFLSRSQALQRANHFFNRKGRSGFLCFLRQKPDQPLRGLLERGPVANGEQKLAELLLKDDDDGQNSDGNELAEDFAHEVHAHQGHHLPDDVDRKQPNTGSPVPW